MAKDLKSRMVLDLGDFRSSLTAAERETRRTVAAIERDSGRSVTALRGAMLGGIGSGGSVAELQAFKREQMVLARTGREKFDAQIGDGMMAAGMARGLAGGGGGASAMAKAGPYILAASAALNVANVAVDAFQGKFDKALDTAKQIPVVGAAIIKPIIEIAEKVGWIKKDTEGAAAAMKSYAERAQIAADFTTRMKNARESADRAGRSVGLSGDDEKQMTLANRRKDELAAIDRDLADATRKLRDQRNTVTTDLKRDDPRARAAGDQYERDVKRLQQEAQSAKSAINNTYALQSMNENQRSLTEDSDRRWAEKKKANEAIQALDAQLAQQTLIAQDKAAEAELAGIREAGRQKVQQYREQGNELAAMRQQQLTDLEVANRTRDLDRVNDERRSAGQAVLMDKYDALYGERQRQSRYDPYAGNMALQSQTLTRVPGAGNKAVVEDEKTHAELRTLNGNVRSLTRAMERNQLVPADL